VSNYLGRRGRGGRDKEEKSLAGKTKKNQMGIHFYITLRCGERGGVTTIPAQERKGDRKRFALVLRSRRNRGLDEENKRLGLSIKTHPDFDIRKRES